MGTAAEEQTQVHAQGSDVGACFTAAPEDNQLPLLIILQQPILIYSADPQLALHC